MNITLRKANAVQNSINEAIRGIKIETNIEQKFEKWKDKKIK